MNINQISTNQSQPQLMRPQYQQQLRCYLCEIPKQDYSLTRSFSEIICRACLNYEGSERVEQLIAEARRTKGATAAVSPASSLHSHHANEHNHTHPQQQQHHHHQAAQETINQTEAAATAAAKQTNGIDVANIQLPAALRNCYYLTSSGGSSSSNDKTTKTDTPARPERPPSIIDVETLPAGGASQQRHLRYDSEFNSSAEQQTPVTNHLKRSLTRSSSPTIVLETSSHAHEHQQQRHRGEVRANQERQQRNQAAAAQLAVRAKSDATAKAGGEQDARQLPTKLDYCPQLSNECLMDNERALNRSFGFEPAATSPSPQPQQQQQHGFASRNTTQSPVGHPLQERNNQQVAAQSARQQTKMNDYMAQQQQQQTMNSYHGMMRAAVPSDQQQQQQQSHRETTNHEHMSRYQSSAAAIAAAAAATAAYYKQIDGLGACVHDPEGLHRLMQECNVYAPGGACSRSGAPFYLRPQHIPTTSGAQPRNFQSTDGSRLMLTTTTANDHKQQVGQQASPTSLYGQYIPMTMTSYMTPNGPILCPSQYGGLPPPPPYHPQQLLRSGMIRPPGAAQYITSNTGAPPSYGPASAALDKRQPPVSQQAAAAAVAGGNELFDQDNHLRNLLTTSQATTAASQQPVDYNPSLSMMRTPTANSSEQHRRVRSSTPSLDMTSGFGDAKQNRANVKSIAAGGVSSPSESPGNDLEKPSLGNSATNPLDVSDEDTSSGQLLQILDGNGGDGCDTQHSDTASQKSGLSKSQQESIKQQQQDDERRRRDLATPRKSPPSSPGPQPKRLALGFSPSKSMMSYETGKEPRAPVGPSQQSAAPVAAPTKQHMTRRSHGHSELERCGSGSRSPPSHGSDKVESHAATSHNGANENVASPKSTRTTTTTTTSRSGGADYNLYSNTNGTMGSGGKDHAPYQIPPAPGVKTTTKPYQNGTHDPPPPSSGRAGYTRASSDSTRENASLSSRKTKGSHHHHSSSSSSNSNSNSSAGISSSTSAARSQPQTSTPSGNTTHYNPLKCMSCKERLEDRHFVQCPSVVAHKFCFGCSKISIERQQAENKNLKGGLERIFCPSGKLCHLANEQTPWTFMNSEIETIIRESSRQSSSSAATGTGQQATNKLNGVSGNGGGAVGDYQVPKQRQQQQQPTAQQNGHSKQNDLAKIS